MSSSKLRGLKKILNNVAADELRTRPKFEKKSKRIGMSFPDNYKSEIHGLKSPRKIDGKASIEKAQERRKKPDTTSVSQVDPRRLHHLYEEEYQGLADTFHLDDFIDDDEDDEQEMARLRYLQRKKEKEEKGKQIKTIFMLLMIPSVFVLFSSHKKMGNQDNSNVDFTGGRAGGLGGIPSMAGMAGGAGGAGMAGGPGMGLGGMGRGMDMDDFPGAGGQPNDPMSHLMGHHQRHQHRQNQGKRQSKRGSQSPTMPDDLESYRRSLMQGFQETDAATEEGEDGDSEGVGQNQSPETNQEAQEPKTDPFDILQQMNQVEPEESSQPEQNQDQSDSDQAEHSHHTEL